MKLIYILINLKVNNFYPKTARPFSLFAITFSILLFCILSSTLIPSQIGISSPPVFATSNNENGADGNDPSNQEKNGEATGTGNDSGNTGLDQSKDIETESTDDTNNDAGNSGTGFDNSNTFDNSNNYQSDSEREQQQPGDQETRLQDDFDSTGVNNQFSNINKDLQSSNPPVGDLLAENDIPIGSLRYGHLGIFAVTSGTGAYFGDKLSDELAGAVSICVQTRNADGKVVSAIPSCSTGANKTHEFDVVPGLVQMNMNFDPRLTVDFKDCSSSIDFIEAMESKECMVIFSPSGANSDIKPNAFFEVDK